MKQILGRYAPRALALAGVLALAACSAPLVPPLGETDTNTHGGAAGGAQVQSGAIRAWSGGIRAWSGGIRAWSGGGELERTGAVLLENADIWERLSLAAAHQALAPKLGRGVTVAVIDTGVDVRHPIFSGRLSERSSWYDFVDGDRDPDEVPGAAFGHGTMVASIVLQLAPEATIMPLRVLDGDGGGDADAVVAAIDWALARGAEVIQLSLGTEEPVPALEAAVARAAARGVYTVASAGNSNANPTYPAYTAMLATPSGDMSVGVGSVDLSDRKSAFSNFAPDDGLVDDGLEMVAFGEAVYGAIPDGQIAAWDGTSMAAPMVAGALALALGEGAEALSPGRLALEVVESALEIDAEGTANGRAFELEKRLEVALFLCSALNLSEAGCLEALEEGLDDDDDDDDD
jgi:thermitase